jgi:YggT family protein
LLFWRVVGAFLVVYLLLLSLRILLSWFQGSVGGRPWQLLVRITEPYLSLFRGLAFLRRGALDFSPLAAVLALVVALNLVTALQHFGRLTLGILLAAVVGALWSGVSFLVILLLVVLLIVLLMSVLRRGPENPLLRVLAAIVAPLVGLVRRLLWRRSALGDAPALLLSAVLLFAFLFVGGTLVALLRTALLGLPV